MCQYVDVEAQHDDDKMVMMVTFVHECKRENETYVVFVDTFGYVWAQSVCV